MSTIKLALATAIVAVMSGSAGAATLSLVGSGYSTHTLTSNFDLDNVGAPYTSLTGGFGVDGDTLSVLLSSVKDSTNGLSVDGPAKVTYTYLGKEAGFTNRLKFSAGDTTLFETGASLLGDLSGPFDVLAGLLPFKLTSQGDGQVVFNNDGATADMNIGYLLLSATSALVFLDDFGGGPDSDFDDIGIRVDISAVPLPAVPLPAALPLLATGVGAMGLLGWRRKRKAGATAAA